MVPAVIATGLAKSSSCQPLAVSPPKVPVASSVPAGGPQAARCGCRC